MLAAKDRYHMSQSNAQSDMLIMLLQNLLAIGIDNIHEIAIEFEL